MAKRKSAEEKKATRDARNAHRSAAVAEKQLDPGVAVGELGIGALVELPNDVSLYKITAKDQDLVILSRQGTAPDGSFIDLQQRPVCLPLQCLVRPK